MLYLAVMGDDGNQRAGIFVRNSGTEEKTGVKSRALAELNRRYRECRAAVAQKNEAILGLLDGYKNGLSTAAAFEAVLGLGPEDFDESFNAYVEEMFEGPLMALRPALDDEGGHDLQASAPPGSLKSAAEA